MISAHEFDLFPIFLGLLSGCVLFLSILLLVFKKRIEKKIKIYKIRDYSFVLFFIALVYFFFNYKILGFEYNDDVLKIYFISFLFSLVLCGFVFFTFYLLAKFKFVDPVSDEWGSVNTAYGRWTAGPERVRGHLKLFRPVIDDPYPCEFGNVTEFRYETRLVLSREPFELDETARENIVYILEADFSVSFKLDGVRHSITVPRGMLITFGSMPKMLLDIVGDLGPHLEALILHEYLFIAWQLLEEREPRKVDLRFANEVMFAALRAASCPVLPLSIVLRFPIISWGVFHTREDGPNGKSLFVDLDTPLSIAVD